MCRRRMMRPAICPIAALFALGGCSQMPALPAIPTLTPYKIDIQQGNVVTQEMVEKLKPGMTPSQVRFILGTPLVVDAFHKDRWDYVYRFSKAGTLQESRRIVVVFKDDKLDRIEGDVVPAKPGSATEGGVTIAPGGKPGAAKPTPDKAPAAAKPEAAKTGADATAGAGAPGAAPVAEATSAKPEPEPPKEKPKEERGFFGKMLDSLGF